MLRLGFSEKNKIYIKKVGFFGVWLFLVYNQIGSSFYP